jgi:hypothetical protein
VVARTKSKIACFAAPLFHQGNRSLDVAVCADAQTSVPDKTGSTIRTESAARRLTLAKEGFGDMVGSC